VTLDIAASLIVKPGEPANLAGRDPADRLGLPGRAEVESLRGELLGRLRDLQERLWAEASRSVLLVLQGLDTSGKDGTIEHVFSGVNPQGIHDASFKPPTHLELAHDYLWRVHQACPARGEIGIFNRSHYEDIVTVRVQELVPEGVWERRYRHVREWERMLSDEGTAVVKVYLHISKEEQRARLAARLENPAKMWKFRSSDLESRARWEDFIGAYEEALTQTSTKWAPWYVVPADRKWVRNVVVSQLLVETLERLDPQFPQPQEDLSGVEIV
jgi:PPK2 family polyphosphate:nucleotide phosphotransferase